MSLTKPPWLTHSNLGVSLFLGRIEDTRDALIVVEACRQGLLPRINRRLLAAEREGIIKSEPYDDSDGPATRTRQATTPNPSLIEAGSVFVFDEDESGICRWTDGRIWSPSRICGNFLVYRELYRKLPDQKCWTAKDKAGMKDGNGLKDKMLQERVKKENLVVLGCMKGTFVLKKDGLVKKTICVRGIELLPPEELRGRSIVASRLRTGKGATLNRPPGFKLAGTQHLVAYERPGAAMKSLHRPREYVQLRDLPISKTFVLEQKYRNPLQITPLPRGQLPIDPWDEYINSERIIESRSPSDPQTRSKRAKPSLDDGAGSASSSDFISDEYAHQYPTDHLPAPTATSHTVTTVSHPYATRSHSHQLVSCNSSQVTSRLTRSSARSLRRSTRLTSSTDRGDAEFSSQRKSCSADATSSERGVFIKDEEFASASSTDTPVYDSHDWTTISPADSQLEVHGVKLKDGQRELLPFSADGNGNGHMEAASSAILPSIWDRTGYHEKRTLTDDEGQETTSTAAWKVEQAGALEHTPPRESRQHDRGISLSPPVPLTLTEHSGDLPIIRSRTPEDWLPSGARSSKVHSEERMRMPTKSVSPESEKFTSGTVRSVIPIRDEVSLGANEPSTVTKVALHEYSPSTLSSSLHSERSCGLSLSSSLSLSPAGNSSSTNSPSTMRSPRINIPRRSGSKTPLSPMYEHDEVEDSAVTSAAMILTSALSENQLSHKTTSRQASEGTLEHRVNWNQIQVPFGSNSNAGTCSDGTATASMQMHSSSPTSSGLTYDSSTSFTGAADPASEPRAQQRRYMSPSNYLFPGVTSTASSDHPEILDASAHPYSTDSLDSASSTQPPAGDTYSCDPGEIYQQEEFSRCCGENLGYVFDQEPLGGIEANLYSPDTRHHQSFVDSTRPDLEVTTSSQIPHLTPGTLSAMHSGAMDDCARSGDDLDVSADESLGKAEYLLHPQHSRLSQLSQLSSDPSSEARQDRRSDRFSDENQPWALRRHEDAAQDMFPGLIDLRPRSSAHESSASGNPCIGDALEQHEFLEDRLERDRLARTMKAVEAVEAVDDDDLSSGSELTDGTRSDDTGLLYSPTPA
ncbi:hypothetical protein EC968_006256 [Mortierella alpina]|nr:hypothetical protein EC968_006256 [Mortierella alpina]